MKRISEIIRKYFFFRQDKFRLINLHASGFIADSKTVMFEDFSEYCWMPTHYDSDDCYDAKGKFIAHAELHEYPICWN